MDVKAVGLAVDPPGGVLDRRAAGDGRHGGLVEPAAVGLEAAVRPLALQHPLVDLLLAQQVAGLDRVQGGDQIQFLLVRMALQVNDRRLGAVGIADAVLRIAGAGLGQVTRRAGHDRLLGAVPRVLRTRRDRRGLGLIGAVWAARAAVAHHHLAFLRHVGAVDADIVSDVLAVQGVTVARDQNVGGRQRHRPRPVAVGAFHDIIKREIAAVGAFDPVARLRRLRQGQDTAVVAQRGQHAVEAVAVDQPIPRRAVSSRRHGQKLRTQDFAHRTEDGGLDQLRLRRRQRRRCGGKRGQGKPEPEFGHHVRPQILIVD